MAEKVTAFLQNLFGSDSIWVSLAIIFIISLMPVLELRGGLIAAAILQVNWWIAFPICVIGNMLPIPFELLFIRKIFEWLKRFGPFRRVIVRIETRAERKGKEIETYKKLGLFILVAVPLPGTGAWTGGLVADLLKMRMKSSIPIIALGVIAAGVIVSIISYGIPALF